MFGGKRKALTFSYDDGVTQDKRLIEILNRYHLKATFNLNSELLGEDGYLERNGKKIDHTQVRPEEVRELYRGHEIAVHTLTHPNLTQQSEDEIVRQVEEDRKNLEALAGYDVLGMAYPCGGVNHDDRVADILRRKTKMQYARTITCNGCFDRQQDLMQFAPTAFHLDKDNLSRLAQDFLSDRTQKTRIFYIWGHSYEFDIDDDWAFFEDFCKEISGREDVFYGTNREVLLGK